MARPGRISASPAENYTSQGASERGRRAAVHLEEALLSPADTRANPLAPHLGLEPESHLPPMMLQLDEQHKFIFVPKKRSSVVAAGPSRATGLLQLDKPALRP